MLWRLSIIWYAPPPRLNVNRAYNDPPRDCKRIILLLPAILSLVSFTGGLTTSVLCSPGWVKYLTCPARCLTWLTYGFAALSGCLMTLLIVCRLYYAGTGFVKHPYRKLILLLVESQALYTASMLVYLILYFVQVRIPLHVYIGPDLNSRAMLHSLSLRRYRKSRVLPRL